MADNAQIKAEMRRRKILLRSEERMKKLLGPNAVQSAESSSVQESYHEEIDAVTSVAGPSRPTDSSPRSTVSHQLQDHRIRAMKMKKVPKETPGKVWFSEMIVFPVGAMTRLSPTYFVPILVGTIFAILMQTQTSSNFWVILACEYLGIDHRRSFGLKVLSLLEKAFQMFFLFTFSFITAHAIVLLSTTGNLHQ